MLLGGEVKGELARIQPARACCRRAELAGLLHGARGEALRTLDHATARTTVLLATSLDIRAGMPRSVAPGAEPRPGRRHHLSVDISRADLGHWAWVEAAACDRRAFLRGLLLGCGSLSFSASGPHVEFVVRDTAAADEIEHRLADMELRSLRSVRRGHHVVYLKGLDGIVTLLGLAGANRGVLELESQRVGSDVRARLNRVLNAEEANLGRTVRAADRQLAAIDRLERHGSLVRLTPALRDTAAARRRMPDADLDALASALGEGRSAVNHRLRRLVAIAAEQTE